MGRALLQSQPNTRDVLDDTSDLDGQVRDVDVVIDPKDTRLSRRCSG
jgi:hypothetical protein